MAEKIIEKEETIITRTHRISCDMCGVDILDAEEHEDGYYNDPSKVEYNIYLRINNSLAKEVRARKQLCDKCKNNFENGIKDLITKFIELGFE